MRVWIVGAGRTEESIHLFSDKEDAERFAKFSQLLVTEREMRVKVSLSTWLTVVILSVAVSVLVALIAAVAT